MKWQERQAEFDKVIHSYGRSPMNMELIDPKSFEAKILRNHREQVRHTIKHVRETNKYPAGFPPVYFDFIDDPTLDAVAFNDKGGMYLGINTGAVYLLTDLFCRIFSHPQVYPSIAKEEQLKPFHSQPFTSNYNDLLNGLGPGGLIQVQPINQSRKINAESFAITAFRILVLHELAHLLRGHCAFRESLGMRFIMELSNASNSNHEEIPLIRQALEIDADDMALRYSSYVFSTNLPPKRDKLGLLFELVLSTICLFWLLLEPTDITGIKTTHPNPAARTALAAEALVSHLTQLGSPDVASHVDKIVLQALTDMNGFFYLFNGNAFGEPASAMEYQTTPEGIEYRKRLLQKRLEMVPQFMKFAPKEVIWASSQISQTSASFKI